MNKKIAIGVVLVVIAIGVYAVLGKDGKNESVVKEQTQSQSEVKAEVKSKSLKDLAMSGKPQKCEFKQVVENSESAGTYFISNGKVRGDYSVKSQGQNISGHMIMDGSTIYSWTDTPKQGFKMEVTGGANAASAQNQNVDINQRLNYDCEDWRVNEEIFMLPKDITFTSLAEITTEASGGAGMSAEEINSMQCKACDSVPTESKAQCKAALNCK